MDDNKIPAFTVLKNGSILKNIFLLRKQESTLDSSPIHQESDEQILLVGRHPHCNITLEHPSISRYHLRIHSNPASQVLSIIDLSSVHGTWVSGKRIDSGVPVELKEGDTVKLGGSSRVYELHWVPLSQAYDVDDPFIPAVYAFKTKQDENCLCPSDDDLEGLNSQKLNPLASTHCSNSCSDDTEVGNSSSSNGNGEIFSTSLVQPSPVVMETISAIEDSNGQDELENQSNWSGDKMGDEFEQLSSGNIKEDSFSVPRCSSSFHDDMEVEHSSPWKTGDDAFATVSVQAPLVVSETIPANEISDDNLNKSEDESCMKDDRVSVTFSDVIVHEDDVLDQDIASDNGIDKDGEYEAVYQQEIENSPVPMALFNGVNRDENVVFMPLRAEGEQVNVGSANSCSDDTEVENSSSSHGNGETFGTSLVQPSPDVVETISAIEDSDGQNELENQSNWSGDKTSDEFEQLSSGNIEEDSFSVPRCSSSFRDDMEVQHSSSWKTGDEIFATVSIQAPLVVSETISANEISDDSLNKSEDESSMKDERVSVAFSDVIIHENDALGQDIASDNEIEEESEYEPVNKQNIENSPVPTAIFIGVNKDENLVFMPLTAEDEQVNLGDFEQMNQTEMMDESASMVLFDGVGGKVDDDVICKSIISREEDVDMGVKLESFNHETPKKDSVLMALPDETHMDQERTSTPDISRTKEIDVNLEAMHNALVSMNLFDGLDANELEIFTPGKENKNPNSCSVKSLKRRWKEDEHDRSNHCTMSKKAVYPADHDDKDIFGFSKQLFTTDEENFVPDTLLQRSPDAQMKMEGSYDSIEYPQTVEKVIDSSQNIMGVAKKRWTMVVDTNSLLHNESLKHLKLLQGLIGTQLFVPKFVIRELMDIKGQDDILKKSTKNVSLALKWIDECMVDTKWWIHVDDEAEPELVETALHLRKRITDRKIIILSDDLTLKIKAMAEGVMCEAAEEFRRSLVNPFSERFMWVGSSARGRTWSSVDDDVLRQKYYGCTVNASYRLKGLKLLANITKIW